MEKYKGAVSLVTEMSKTLGVVNSIKPVWLETINRQRYIFDNSFKYCGLTDGMSAISTALETQKLSPTGILATNTVIQKQMLNITKFDPVIHNSGLQKILLSASNEMSCLAPLSFKALNFSGLSVIENETIAVLKASNISASMPIVSLQLAKAFEPITLMSDTLKSKVDDALVRLPILGNYSTLVRGQYKSIQKDVKNSSKRLKVIELATDMLQEQILDTCEQIEKEEYSFDESKSEENLLRDNKTTLEYIPIYLGYAMREGSAYDLDEEFEKSMLYKILTLGKNVVKKIEYINDLYLNNGEREFFKPTNKSLSAVLCLSTAFSTDETTFGNVIDSLYKLLYEGNGGQNLRVTNLLSDEECGTLWDIKSLRTDFRHDTDHGKEKDFLKKKKEIGRIYKTLCGKEKPLKHKEWVEAHSNILLKVDAWLDLIIEKKTS